MHYYCNILCLKYAFLFEYFMHAICIIILNIVSMKYVIILICMNAICVILLLNACDMRSFNCVHAICVILTL